MGGYTVACVAGDRARSDGRTDSGTSAFAQARSRVVRMVTSIMAWTAASADGRERWQLASWDVGPGVRCAACFLRRVEPYLVDLQYGVAN